MVLNINILIVSKIGNIKIANANAGEDAIENGALGFPEVLMNLINKTEWTNPINNEPVLPINIFAGEKLKKRKLNNPAANENATIEKDKSPQR